MPEAPTMLQVIALQPAYLASLLLATDGLFIISALIFLFIGTRFGNQRYGAGTQPYPGNSRLQHFNFTAFRV